MQVHVMSDFTYMQWVVTVSLLVSSADKLCKQFGSRSGLTKRQTWVGSKMFDTLMSFLNSVFQRSDFKKADIKKSMKNYPVGKVLKSFMLAHICKSVLLNSISRSVFIFQNNSNNPVLPCEIRIHTSKALWIQRLFKDNLMTLLQF